MYVVSMINDGIPTIIHGPGTSNLKISDAQITKEVNKFDSFTFTVYSDNPGFDLVVPFSTLIKVQNVKNGEFVFEGRVISPSPAMDSVGIVSKEVTCEGLMGYLCDSCQFYAEEQYYGDSDTQTGLQLYLQTLLNRHNEAVEEDKRISLGSVTLQTFDTTNGVTKSISRGSTWDNINDKLIDVFGGEMRVRRDEDGVLRLDYEERLGVTRATRIQIARNLIESSQEPDPSEVITRLYPYGCKLTETVIDADGNEVEQETERRLGIETVNDNLPYIDDVVGIRTYGIIEGYQEWDDITIPSNLLAKAQEFLGENNRVPMSTSISAVDLSLLGIDPDSFKIHDWYPVYNPLIGLDETLEIVKQTIDVNEPQNSTFDLGETAYTLSGDIAGGNLPGEYYEFVSTTNTNTTNINNRITTTNASIKVFEDRINSIVSETNTITGDINEIYTQLTNLEQTPDSWTYEFVTQLQQEIQNVDGTYGTIYSEQLKYIKFIDGEIWLGRDPDPGQDDFKVVISNERIRFLQNNIEVAYISNESLSITDATITNALNLGNFMFVPRTNGNLTLRYIGED